MNYYNEHDQKAAAWLRVLIAENLIAKGEVDERDIQDVRANKLDGYRQCHFFAGIGGWSLALRLAGVPDDEPIWTGSCPCQPFSSAGKGQAQNDERHLWPDFFRLIREHRPVTVFGEQVAAAIGFGWLDGISADLEAEGYAVGAHVLGAHSIGAPHKRQRLYWVADDQSQGRSRVVAQCETGKQQRPRIGGDSATSLALANSKRDAGRSDESGRRPEGLAGNGYDGNQSGWNGARAVGPVAETGAVVPVGNAAGDEQWRKRQSRQVIGRNGEDRRSGAGLDAVGNAKINGRERFAIRTDGKSPHGTEETGFWSSYRVIHTRDGKARRIPVEPVFQRMADGLPGGMDFMRNRGLSPDEAAQIQAAMNGFPLAPKTIGRVMALKGFGNAIVPELAAEFIKAYFEIK